LRSRSIEHQKILLQRLGLIRQNNSKIIFENDIVEKLAPTPRKNRPPTTIIAELARLFSYSISYDTCRGHAAFTLFFVRGLLPGLSGAIMPVFARAAFGRSPGFLGAGKIFALDHARHRVTRLTAVTA